jgi:hypothetical protein
MSERRVVSRDEEPIARLVRSGALLPVAVFGGEQECPNGGKP